MASVPNTSTFNFQDVTTAVYNDTNAGRNLSSAFSDATGAFDASYVGSKNQQYNFRNYMATVPTDSYRYYVGEYPGYFGKSTDHGASWSRISMDYEYQAVSCSDSGQYVLVSGAYSVHNVLVSSDFGASFSTVVIDSSQIHSAGAVSGNGQYMYVLLRYGNTLYRSSNYGVNWSIVTSPGDFSPTKYAVSFTGAVVVQGTSSGFKVSRDYGATWSTYATGRYTNALSTVLINGGTEAYALHEEGNGYGPNVAYCSIASSYAYVWLQYDIKYMACGLAASENGDFMIVSLYDTIISDAGIWTYWPLSYGTDPINATPYSMSGATGGSDLAIAGSYGQGAYTLPRTSDRGSTWDTPTRRNTNGIAINKGTT